MCRFLVFYILPILIFWPVFECRGEMTEEEFLARVTQLEGENAAILREINAEKVGYVDKTLPASSDSILFQFSERNPNDPEVLRTANQTYNMAWDDLEAELARYKNWTWKRDSFTITPYAWFWLTGVWESNETFPGEYPLYVQPRFGDDERSHSYFDMKSMRLGAIITAPESHALPGVQISGVFEIDFEGKYIQDNETDILLRKAYLELKNDEFLFLAGQTWEIIHPLVLPMVNWGGGAFGGNLGYRRPMLRYDRYWKQENGQWTFQAGILSSNTANLAGTANGTYEGKMGRVPEFQFRLERSWETFGFWKNAMVAVGGRYAQKEFQTLEHQFSADSWSINLDWLIRFTDKCFLMGQYYYGQVLSANVGGVMQDINPQTLAPIRCAGGWLSLSYDFTPKTHGNIGYSIDDPLNQDLGANMRSFNSIAFANISYDFTKSLNMGIEYAYYSTGYVDLGVAKSNHITVVLNYKL